MKCFGGPESACRIFAHPPSKEPLLGARVFDDRMVCRTNHAAAGRPRGYRPSKPAIVEHSAGLVTAKQTRGLDSTVARKMAAAAGIVHQHLTVGLYT